MSRTRRARPLGRAAAGVLVGVLTGCGGAQATVYRDPTALALAAARAMARGDPVGLCGTLTPHAQRFYGTPLLRREPRTRPGAACVVVFRADFRDPNGDLGQFRMYGTARVDRVSPSNDGTRVTVRLSGSPLRTAHAVQAQGGAWLLTGLPDEG